MTPGRPIAGLRANLPIAAHVKLPGFEGVGDPGGRTM